MKLIQLIILLVIVLPQVSCKNLFEDFADSTSDEALLYAAKINMNDSDWTSALANFASMSATFRDRRDVRLQHAKAYAGNCGLELLGLFETLASANLAGGDRLYDILMQTLTGITPAQAADCVNARDTILGISTDPADRTVDENMTLAFIGFSVIGAILTTHADVNADNAVDGGFDGCTVGASPPNIPDNLINELGISLGIADAALTEALADGALDGSDELNEVSGACANLITAGAPATICSHTDTSTVVAAETTAFRWTVIDNVAIGIGGTVNCDLTTGVSCPTACP